MKQVIFNVGGALSTYIEFDGLKLIVDIGKSDTFNPVTDFLIPLFSKRNSPRYEKDETKFNIDQLIISHPHNDHISAIEEFRQAFYPGLLTCPNDNDGMEVMHKINWDLFEENPNIDILREFLTKREPPLRTASSEHEFINYLPPRFVENSIELCNESYCNNISIATFLILNNYRIFMPGDVQKLGMIELLKDTKLHNLLHDGVDLLIAPHHGLRSSFSEDLFSRMPHRKTRCINIVSEKINGEDSRNVDTRYSSTDYCNGINNLRDGNNRVCQIKTSRGHIYVDYSMTGTLNIEILPDIDDVLDRFIF